MYQQSQKSQETEEQLESGERRDKVISLQVVLQTIWNSSEAKTKNVIEKIVPVMHHLEWHRYWLKLRKQIHIFFA